MTTVNRCRRGGQSRRQSLGQVIVVFAISMALFMMGMIALVINLNAEFKFSAASQAAAQIAAQAGANDLDPRFLYGAAGVKPINLNAAGSTVLPSSGYPCPDSGGCTPDYQVACADAGDVAMGFPLPSGYGQYANRSVPNYVYCSTNAAGTCVTAEVHTTVRLPLLLWGASVVVKGTFSAAPVSGAETPAPTPIGGC